MRLASVDHMARLQYGLVTRSQLGECGVPAGTIATWLASGRLLRLHPGVYRLTGTAGCVEQTIMAAVLAGGTRAVASHRAAAWLWGLSDDWAAEISVPRGRCPRLNGVVLHRSRDLAPGSVRRRRGIPTTDPMRALADLGAVVPVSAVHEALERGLTRRLFTVASVESGYDAVSRRGRSGAGVLRQVLDTRALGGDRPDGLLEVRMARLLRAHGIPEPVFQHEVRGPDGRLVARVDFAYPDLRLVIEVDGWETHGSPAALQHDLDRQNDLVALGWRVLRFTWHDVVRRPEKVAQRIATELGTFSMA